MEKSLLNGPAVPGDKHTDNFVIKGNGALIMCYDHQPHFIFHDDMRDFSFLIVS